MQIHLPNTAFLGNIDPFLRSFDPSNAKRLEITANKKWISVHPAVLSMLAALGKTALRVTCETLEAKSGHYLERMGLFRMLGISSGLTISTKEPAGRFIPLQIIKNARQRQRFITDMIPLLHLQPEQARPIEYVVSELINNVLEHSRSRTGAVVCAQYYKKSNRISIGIADNGVGILHSINKSHGVTDHLNAIHLALTPGITGTTRREGGTELNAGAGLFFIKSIAKVSKDFFVVYSGNALYKLLKTPSSSRVRLYADPLKDRHSQVNKLPFFQGTVVGIDLSLQDNEEFSTLLTLIHEVYMRTIRERKKERYRRPRFI